MRLVSEQCVSLGCFVWAMLYSTTTTVGRRIAYRVRMWYVQDVGEVHDCGNQLDGSLGSGKIGGIKLSQRCCKMAGVGVARDDADPCCDANGYSTIWRP
jgi:hypothetical protein